MQTRQDLLEADFVVVGAGSAGCVDGGAAQRGPGDPGRAARGRRRGHATAGSTSRSASARPSPTRRSTGATRPSPIPAPTAAASSGRAARCSAARRRSTAWSISAASTRISTTGASSAIPAGRSTDVLPYFKRAEHQTRGADEFHGTGGPLCVSDMPEHHPICEAFIEGAMELGYPRNDDFNGATQDGVGYHQTTTRNGRRCSTAVGYLRPAMQAAQSARHHRRADREDRCSRARARSASTFRRERPAAHRARRARGDPVRRRGQLAAAPAAVRRRAAGSISREFGIPVVHASARRRAEPAGPLLGADQAASAACRSPSTT